MSKDPVCKRIQVGQLSCVTVDLPDPATDSISPECLVVLCHGFGAGGTDLVPCAGEILSRMNHENRHKIRFLFPAAPILLEEMGGYDSRAWWPIDMMKLQTAMAAGSFRELRKESPKELPEVYQKLTETLDQQVKELGIGWDKVVVGGFSQGSMLTTHFALHHDPTPAGLIAFSGTLLNEEVWKKAQPAAGLKVIQSHGRQDMILPFDGAELLSSLLTKAKADLQFFPFNGPHTIDPVVYPAVGKMLDELVS